MAQPDPDAASTSSAGAPVPPVIFSSPGAVDDPKPMPSRPPVRRSATPRRRD
ncbi:hypothetical protein ACFY36_01365 [Actinoplanes sp. NPDC000266]